MSGFQKLSSFCCDNIRGSILPQDSSKFVYCNTLEKVALEIAQFPRHDLCHAKKTLKEVAVFTTRANHMVTRQLGILK